MLRGTSPAVNLFFEQSFKSIFIRLSIRFPFNVLRDPMYVGSTMCFAATALW